MRTMTTYTGGCHCGAVRYEAESDLSMVISCNCSHCEIKGLVLTFVSPTQFSITAGEDKLSDYKFNKHVILHRFCSICGVQPFGFGKDPEGNDVVALNVRTFDGHVFDTVTPTPFSGRGI